MTAPSLHVLKATVRAPIDRVFYELTRTDAPQACAQLHRLVTTGLTPGEPLQWRTRSGRHTAVVGHVQRMDAPHHFAHSFAYARHDDPPFDASYELAEDDGATALTLTLRGVPMDTLSAAEVVPDMRRRLRTLQRIAERGRPSLHMRLRWWLQQRLERWQPARCRSEHWPLGADAIPAPNEPAADTATPLLEDSHALLP